LSKNELRVLIKLFL